jgi:hypothetical protein
VVLPGEFHSLTPLGIDIGQRKKKKPADKSVPSLDRTRQEEQMKKKELQRYEIINCTRRTKTKSISPKKKRGTKTKNISSKKKREIGEKQSTFKQKKQDKYTNKRMRTKERERGGGGGRERLHVIF